MEEFIKHLFGVKSPPPQEGEKATELTLAKAGLERIAPDVLHLAHPSVRIVNHAGPGGGEVGTSRLGGQPDLPDGQSWPAWKGAPMSFVGQIRLQDVAPLRMEPALPSNGLLSFFYDSKQGTYGDDPADRGGWQVLYFHGDASILHPQPFPGNLAAEARFKPLLVSFQTEQTFPPAPKSADPTLNWSDKEVQGYENWLVERFSPEERAQPKHRMFGYPDQIQDDMQIQCALVSHGFHSQDDPGAAAAVQSKADWQLLLQVDSDDRLGMRWGSAGMIYYWIERPALQKADFGNTWLVMQSD